MPATYNFEISRGNTVSLDFTLVDGGGQPIDLTGSTFDARVYSPKNPSNPVAEFDVTSTGANSVRAVLTSEQTGELFAGNYRWEFQWTTADGEPWDLLIGMVHVTALQRGSTIDSFTLTVTSTNVDITIELPGTQGPSGPAGPAGDPGPQGPEGDVGPAGAQGLQGPQGPQGPEGDRGPEGPQGLEGPEGAAGAEGAQGPQGPQGPEGPDGPQGETGAGIEILGELANETELPATGTAGDAYLIASDLYVWDDVAADWVNTGTIQGPEGPAGPTGPEGPQGIQGETGLTGPEGPQGQQGIQGETGATGPEGPQGIQGDTGPAGPGVPVGGTAGQSLVKASGTDYDTEWIPSTEFKTVWNGTASSIPAGTLVEINDSAGSVPVIRVADKDTAVSVDGITLEAIAASTTGTMQIHGTLGDLNTGGLTAGTPLWLGDDGAFQDSAPAAAAIIRVGKVGVVAPSGGTIILNLPAFPSLASETEYSGTLTADRVGAALDELDDKKAEADHAHGKIALAPTPSLRRRDTVSTMATGHGWTLQTAGTITDDTFEPCLADQSLRIEPDVSTTCNVRITGTSPSVDMLDNYVGVWLKTDSMTDISELRLYVTGDGFSSFAVFDLDEGSGATRYTTNDQWTLVVLSNEAIRTVSGTPDYSSVDTFQLRVVTTAAATVWLGGLATFEKPTEYPRGVVSVTFDDGHDSQDILARPILEQYGIPVTSYVTVELLGDTDRLTLTDLKRLRDANGWDIAGHSFTTAAHDNRFDSLTVAELEDELDQLSGWLADEGFSPQLAYPGGVWNTAISDEVRARFQSGRTALSHTPEIPRPAHAERLRAVSSISSIGTTATQVQELIDEAYEGGHWLILVFHQIIEGTPSATTQCSDADFETIASYIDSKGIAVRTVSEVIAATGGDPPPQSETLTQTEYDALTPVAGQVYFVVGS